MQNSTSFPLENSHITSAIQSAPHSSRKYPASAFELPSAEVEDKGGFAQPSRSPLSPPHQSTQSSQLQLPTPQSPGNVGNYLLNHSYIQESPVHNCPQKTNASTTVRDRLPAHVQFDEEDRRSMLSQQTITPESSPLTRMTPRYTGLSTPKPQSTLRAESPVSKGKQDIPLPETPPPPFVPEHSISSPTVSPGYHPSQLSSPFVSKSFVPGQASKPRAATRSRSRSATPDHSPSHVNDIFTTFAPKYRDSEAIFASLSTLESSPPRTPVPPSKGGEMERIRKVMIQDRLAHLEETESRRPEYLKRSKRSLSETDPFGSAEESSVQEPHREAGIGIMETPVKGRRLKLFQETSEESFEESLMAGGYGRYRTADWIRQPQPILSATSRAIEPSDVISASDQAEAVAPLTQKEVKKRKRLAAFRERTNGNGIVARLHPVELEGRGRVILDVPANNGDIPASEGALSKKKSIPRRKKKSETNPREKKGPTSKPAKVGDLTDKPNWPDTEFPWRLRTEERVEELKAEEAERLKWIERFLDRLSDDEDEPEDDPRGKDVPKLYGNKGVKNSRDSKPRMRHSARARPDPADALVALTSKKIVRKAPYFKRHRPYDDTESDEEILCICNGRDDGRELVQCDGCQTWYHLECIGIRNVSELGREEDPWFCHHCRESKRSPSFQPGPLSEPIFAPTDDHPDVRTEYDAPFFQPISLHASPLAWDHSRQPKTPTRNRGVEHEPGLSSGSSWPESLRNGPSTPQNLVQDSSVYAGNMPGPFDHYSHSFPYESPFDPTSTPSRGMRFSAPFATPKNNLWPPRSHNLFRTPNVGSGRGSSSKSSGITSSGLDSSGTGTGGYLSGYSDDESPVRRVKSSGRPKAHESVDSLLALRSAVSLSYHLPDSPVMRSSETDKRREISHSSMS